MKKFALLLFSVNVVFGTMAQDRMTPELLWKVGRVSGLGVTSDGKSVIYKVTTPNVEANSSSSVTYQLNLVDGQSNQITTTSGLLPDKSLSPDGKHSVITKEVKVKKVFGKDYYPELQQSEVQIYDALTYRHWDEWEDGSFGHLFIKSGDQEKDIMADQPYDCPQKPFGGDEDYAWSPDSKYLVYVTKKKSGTEYAVSTNTDLFAYELSTGKTSNLSEGMMGYDTSPLYAANGTLAWLSMKRDGYESDKNDIVIKTPGGIVNLTASWDGTVNSFTWSADSKKIYFVAPIDGTIQLFVIDVTDKSPVVKQITHGEFDLTGMIGQAGNNMIVSRTDMNRAAELFSVNLGNGQMTQLTHVNDELYRHIKLSQVERREVTTTDNKKMLVYVIYPPDFDPSKKYPTLLYCQGGPQTALTQFYSYRWNFQLMAANGYIIVAPNRRGMPGHGVAWNEEISKDHGGQAMRDYLSAIDEVSKEPFVDKDRLGCVGASYGGYSVFYLAGIHEGRFKTFISHDGIFDLRSMYGTTEEMWFVNWDLGGSYWDKNNAAAVKSYNEFDPANLVNKWDTPILIFQGGKDYRVPIGQGQEAFQAAQLKGIKSRFIYIPNENHWVLHAQNAIVWQREFFRWLKETL